MPFRDDKFADLPPETSPEERLLWYMIYKTAQALKLGLSSDDKNVVIEAMECFDWFFKKNRRNPTKKLKLSDFRSVCKVLNIDAKRIQDAIRANEEFPTRPYLRQKLAKICEGRRQYKLRKRKARRQ